MSKPDLLQEVPSLLGKKLACHCHPTDKCHADVLIEISRSHVLPPTDGAIAEASTIRGWKGRIKADDMEAHSGPSTVSPQTAGNGPPLWVGRGHKLRRFVDGGGICSPGCWLPDRRRPSPPVAEWLRLRIRSVLEEWFRQDGIDPKKHFSALISGEVTGDAIPAEVWEAVASDLKTKLGEAKVASFKAAERQPQQIEVELLGAFLEACGDPDFKIMKSFSAGVKLGVDCALPRTPLVFNAKTRWSLPEQRVDSGWEYDSETFVGARCANYGSAEQFKEEVRAALEDQTNRGQIRKVSMADAVKTYGNRLAIASLGAIEKGTRADGTTEVRIIHDGTHAVDVNKYIRVQDSIPFPTAPDLARVLRQVASSGKQYFAFTADVKEAHRMVAVAPSDWGFQACQLDEGGDVYLNKCGTYGVGSAAYWWGRLAAGLHRGALYVWGDTVDGWLKLFADDWLSIASGPDFMWHHLGFVGFLRVFKVPLSWKKLKGGLVVPWIGYEIDLRECRLGISERRAAWLDAWLCRVLDQGSVLIREMREALGRMVFVFGALVWNRPFLGPLFSFVAVHRPGECPTLPVFLRSILGWLRDGLRRRRMHPCGLKREKRGAIMRVDAKAEGSVVAVGGWCPTDCPDGAPDAKVSP